MRVRDAISKYLDALTTRSRSESLLLGFVTGIILIIVTIVVVAIVGFVSANITAIGNAVAFGVIAFIFIRVFINGIRHGNIPLVPSYRRRSVGRLRRR